MSDRRLEMMSIAAIATATRNPKDHDIGELSKSIGRFGFADGLIFDERTQRLVAGHGRLEALRALQRAGGEPPEGITRTVSGEWMVPVQRGWASKSDADADAFIIAANRLSEIGGWDQKALDEMLVDLAKGGEAALSGIGFDGDDVDRILRELAPPPAEVVVEPQTTSIRLGDLFALGGHRLLCGDSTSPADVSRLMGDSRAGLMNTDPPYGVGYANADRPNPGVAKPRVAKPRVANDLLVDDALQSFLERAFTAAAGALTQNAAWYLWHAHLTQGFFAAAAAAAANVVLHRQIIWVKPVLLLTRGQYHWKHEPCFFGWVEGHQPPDYGEGNGERTQTTVWEIDGVSAAERKELNHATPKPPRLFEIPIVKHLQRGEICYEPFAGSGPQFIAADQTGRRCFGLELEPIHVQTIINRWEKLTGRKAEKLP